MSGVIAGVPGKWNKTHVTRLAIYILDYCIAGIDGITCDISDTRQFFHAFFHFICNELPILIRNQMTHKLTYILVDSGNSAEPALVETLKGGAGRSCLYFFGADDIPFMRGA